MKRSFIRASKIGNEDGYKNSMIARKNTENENEIRKCDFCLILFRSIGVKL